MTRLIVFFTLFMLTSPDPVYGCDCDSQGPFLTVARKSDLVGLVKVTKYLTYKTIDDRQVPLSMEVEIVEVYLGVETRKIITVWGDNGVLCRPYLSEFKVGRFYVIGFLKGVESPKGRLHTGETTMDYAISSCGHYWLNVNMKKKIASGSVQDNRTKITLTDLKAKLDGK